MQSLYNLVVLLFPPPPSPSRKNVDKTIHFLFNTFNKLFNIIFMDNAEIM